MGGHGHGHGHGDPYVVPDYRIYKVEDAPELVQVQKALASKGLKDPWLRNEVWRFNTKEFGTRRSRTMGFLFRGFKWGLAATVVTVALEKAWEKMNPKDDHHGHGHH
ncbi:NADH dehydrogenase [ubiquinone] 1 beta subcomplex subunit 3-like [Ctenocephalides felis]|uniref:NADH dehydrogenase [ubiquinone] 1 beta subcomplex subunit 3-like n=1 Tax=Ctenocephalides felis TaxID=7515 RepID=UPI000E6E2172|nr:NADH dehydrogenase [ubiquinone] 1 beta subcomplex subunit 3-like [Ctenocephalides felis]XP_026478931.1 NADH dehydrogenase [ubiquinone] 1 beta subcomplex subunit 3-like [Ctenocephalides felis]XP_026479005.1 NADH dehydrogenase [ubiquinone] 1 beta subcomplex subunit 3-like [Ctenocephalides felis]